ncbi:MAG: GTP 3',8-cyclase MoaA [Deltaproteobacteria bacterium]|nr:GTP 3',8-cyclase MoaA [Deltaproteobacteria bacterium]
MSWHSNVGTSERCINYLRLSVTDRCNLRCRYCMGEEGIQRIPHDEILTYEEFLRIIRLTVQRGIRKVRITGGEPLIRKGLPTFIHHVSIKTGVEEITLTTNGVLLEEYAERLWANGIRRVNVSMDSLDPKRFEFITGRNVFHKVWAGIRETQRLGFDPIKLNVVVIKGWNDDEVLDFARLTYDAPYHVRFIEYMPLGGPIDWRSDLVVPAEELLRRIEALGDLSKLDRSTTDGPASRYKLAGARGTIGFISAITHGFCSSCNRLRLTAEGKLRTCLFSNVETDLKSPMRNGAGDEELLDIMDRAVANKPRGHGLAEEATPALNRRMWGIGG